MLLDGLMFNENDLKQIRNLVESFLKNKGYFPFVEDLMTAYSIVFPQDLSKEEKEQINNFINEIILDYVKNKGTKGGQIMQKILERNDELWKEFRELNSEENFEDGKFQELGKKVEYLIERGEDQLTEKLVGGRSMGIQKASDAWYNMVYAIFPLWNKIK